MKSFAPLIVTTTSGKKNTFVPVCDMDALLRVVRRVRTFDLKATTQRHPFLLYGAFCGVLVGWANWAQYQRLAPLYPDFDKYRVNEGGRMMEAKRQEFADVLRYNQMVQGMRNDLNSQQRR